MNCTTDRGRLELTQNRNANISCNIIFMKKDESLKLLGLAAKRVNSEPEIEHLLFYQCLMLSKSYEIAHRIRTKKLRKLDVIPKDIEKVLSTYDLVGNIYGIPFEKWWNKKGYELFYERKPIKRLIVRLNLDENHETLITKVSKAILKAKSVNTNLGPKGITFITNKAQPISLFYRLFLVEAKANRIKDGKDIPYWKIATEINFPSKRVMALNEGIKNIDEANKTREYICMLVSRKLAESKFLVENAARGIFPSIESSFNALDFDFTTLSKLLHKQGIAEIKHMEAQRYANKPVRQWDYASMLIRGVNIKRRKNKRIVAKAKKISESKSPIFALK